MVREKDGADYSILNIDLFSELALCATAKKLALNDISRHDVYNSR